MYEEHFGLNENTESLVPMSKIDKPNTWQTSFPRSMYKDPAVLEMQYVSGDLVLNVNSSQKDPYFLSSLQEVDFSYILAFALKILQTINDLVDNIQGSNDSWELKEGGYTKNISIFNGDNTLYSSPYQRIFELLGIPFVSFMQLSVFNADSQKQRFVELSFNVSSNGDNEELNFQGGKDSLASQNLDDNKSNQEDET